MASDDVIELGSSDEESEPAPKRRKPLLNAMVHIPGKLPGLTVTSSKNTNSRLNPLNILKGSIGQAVTVTKIPKSNVNPLANNKNLNGNPRKGPIMIKSVGKVKQLPIPIKRGDIPWSGISIANPSKTLNPLYKSVQNTSNINVVNQSRGKNLNIVKLGKSAPERTSTLKRALTNTNLPPGITIKRTTPLSKGNKSRINLKNPLSVAHMTNEGSATQTVYDPVQSSTVVPTVELDDDELATSTGSGPQWYLRPEEQKKEEESLDPLAGTSSPNETEIEIPVETLQKTSTEKLPLEPSALEEQNNKEPDKKTYIEITIDDSPVKPSKLKKGFQVGAELAITIEDSPAKDRTDKTDTSKSDDEENITKERNSKKRLDYPKTVETVQIVEVEFEPHPEGESITEKKSLGSERQKSLTPPKQCTNIEKNINSEKSKIVLECIDIVEIEESPIKPMEKVNMSTPKKTKQTKPAFKMIEQIETIVLDDKEKEEFTPIYQSFINLCFQLENSEDMKKIVEKKIKAYYRQVPKEYIESETFTDMMAGKIMAMKAGPEKMYLYIKDVVDELNLQRKLAKAQPAKEKEEQDNFLYGEDSEFDAKRQRQIRKLEKTLKKLHRAIQKLEEQEVDFDDEEDSVYLLTESENDSSSMDSKPINKEVLLQRYKERSVRVHAKLCQLTNTRMPSEARVQIEPRLGQPKGPAKRIEKWINRKVPIGTPLPFPDFHDVLRCVREANQEDKLGWNEADIVEEARDLFVQCGKKLQRRRQENEWRLAASRIPAETVDPAEDSAELKRKLEENRRVASKKETEVFNKYADRQNQLKLEAVEIGDKEAEESPVESDDEEPIEINDSMTNKQKRKERLKRLLQEKSKASEDKGNQPYHLPTEVVSSQKDATKDSNETVISAQENERGAIIVPLEPDVPAKEPTNSNLSNKDEKTAVESDASSQSKGNSNTVDSDVDELHLLEKLYSENEYNNSAKCSSDTGSPIAISDSSSMNDKTSSDERRNKKTSSDVISIENSSYSETDEKKEDSSKETEAEIIDIHQVAEEYADVNMEVECSVDEAEKTTNKTNYEECNALLEDILLASSDEADDTEPRKGNLDSEPCVNLRDDNISIGETLIIENRVLDGDSEGSRADNSDKNTITDGSSVEGMEIEPLKMDTVQNRVDNVEISSVESIDEENTTNITNTKSPEVNEENSPAKILGINSVESVEEKTSSENTKEISSLNFKENIYDGNNKETITTSDESMVNVSNNEACEKSLEARGDETASRNIDISVNEIPEIAINTTANIKDINKSSIDKNSIADIDNKSKKDGTIQSSEDNSMTETNDVKQATKSTIKETKDNNNSDPDAMEIDSVEKTL